MEFLLLLIVTLVVAVTVSATVIRAFTKPVDKILSRVIGDEIASAWRKFLMFALFVVGVSSGVNIWKLEQFVRSPQPFVDGKPPMEPPALTPEYWGLEIYRTIIETLGGLAWALLVFFVVALIAFVIARRKEPAA